MKFNRIKQLTSDIENLKIALADSETVELSEDETSIRRKFPIDNDKDVDECTIYVEKLPDAVDHDWLSDLFSSFGRVDHVSLPRFKNNKQIMGFAFVEFDNQRSASKACNFFSFLDSHKQEPAEERAENESPTLIDKLLDNLSVTEINSMNDRIDQRTGADAKNENKRSADDTFGDEATKRFKTENDSQSEEFASLLEYLKTKYQQNVGQLTHLRVISKFRWMAYKREYLYLKKNEQGQRRNGNDKPRMEMAGTSGSQAKKRKDEKKKEQIEFGSGLIVKLEYAELTGGEGVFKRELRSLASEESSIAYIDVQPESSLVYLRFKESQSALDYLQNDRLNAFGKAVLLDGEEEQTYWAFIKQGLVNKKAKQKEKSQRLREKKEQMKKANEDEKMEPQSNQHDNRQSTEEQPNRIANYEKGLIIKLQMDIDLNNEPSEQELKKRIKAAANNSYIGYIDLDTSVFNLFLTSELIRKTCFIRCKTAELAKKVLDGEEFKALGESAVLEGEEECAYWQRVKECSMRKHQSKKSKH